jgi:hypothetical protein
MGYRGPMKPFCKKPAMLGARCRWRGVAFLFAGVAGLLLGSPANAASRLPCGPQAITCVEVMQSGAVTDTQPVTFGQVFKIGDVPRQAHLAAEDGQGKRLPLQVDESATYPDGSLRFAVLSTLVPHMAANETRLVSLLRGESPGPPPPAPAARFDLGVELTTHFYQTTIIKFGNRNGHTPGIPFKLGENIAFHIGEERFSLPVTPAMAGGDFASYQNIAQAFVKIVNDHSRKVRASWNGAEAGFEEDLWLTSTSDEPFVAAIDYKGPAKISILPYQKPEPAEKWNATLRSEQGALWLNGGVAVERDIAVPLVAAKTGKAHPLLSLRVHLRRYPAAAAVRADVVFENDWSYAPGPRNLLYDVAISRNGEAVYHRQAITHTHHARWHTVIWSEGRKDPVVKYDIPYFVNSGLVPHYDSSIRISPAALAADGQQLEKADSGPLGTGAVTTYMPMTGMRGDIGPLPVWTAQYLLSMDTRARALMLVNANAAGGMPMHYRDQATDLPVSLDRHPGLTMTFGTPRPGDAFPNVEIRTNPWTLDVAHHPSLTYVPYLVTGDLYYLEETMFFANWVMGSVDPGLRGAEKGLLWGNQVRGTAWAIRTLGQAAIILPDLHPMKGYFNAKLQNNLEYYISHFVRSSSPATSPLGIVENVEQNGVIGPWQYDFFFLSVADLARAGVPHAAELAQWMARFVVGRWSNEAQAQGYCYRMAPAYYVKFRDPAGRPLRDWGALFRANWPDVKSCPATFTGDSGSDSPVGYVANSYAALGAAANLSIPGAREEQERIARDSRVLISKFAEDPTFAIIP